MNSIVPWILIAVGIGMSAWILTEPSTDFVDSQHFQDRVNLAMRQAGDQMLKLSGDYKTPIPPVRQEGDHYYVMNIQTKLHYDTLPYILERSLSFYNIQSEYSVTIRDCNSDTIRLGYNSMAFQRNEVACIDRDHTITCSNIGLNLVQPKPIYAQFEFLGLCMMLLGISWLIVRQRRRFQSTDISMPNKKIPGSFQFGNTKMDIHTQILEIGKTKITLTYRECKLLQFLCQNVNRVVERDRIIEEVWGSEGVIVGRSLDVFISRLRKILKDDHSVQIKNVHGVGYRLEVA